MFYRFIILILLLSACSSKARQDELLTPDSPNIFVASYGDFGVSYYSSKLIGQKMWQWNDVENHQPITFDIKVVVYRGLSLEQVKKAFPVIQEKKQDYRYVEYTKASEYFTETLGELEAYMKTLNFEDAGEYYIYPLGIYKTALAMERKLRK